MLRVLSLLSRRVVLATLLSVLPFLAPALCSGQALNTGTIAGNVTDAQGSIVPNATATLTNPTQNKVLTAKVNGKGEYLFTDVAPGTYSLVIAAPTFQGYSVPGIDLNADQNIRIDAQLTAGGASETVTVEAPSATLDTRSATIGAVIDNTLVENLPIDGNNAVALAGLLPGVTGLNAPTTFTSDTGGPTYNVSGARSNQNLFLLDGLLWNNVYYNTGLNFPPPGTLQEVSVQLNNFKAQYGRNVGSVFNAVTRSGTNAFHGTVYDYFQNAALNAQDYLVHPDTLKPHLVQNQFGGTLGGPILRDRMFFFLGYQDLRSAGQVITRTQAPTLAERGLSAPGVGRPCISAQFKGFNCASFAGDFPQDGSTLAGLAAGTSGIKNPLGTSNTYANTALTGLASTWAAQGGSGTSPCIAVLQSLLASSTPRYMPNAEIPDVCFNPVAVNVYNRYVPLPNDGVFAEVAAKQPRNDYNGFARVDWNLGHGHTIDSRIFITNVDDFTSNSSSSGVGVATYEIDANAGGIYSGNIGDTWVISPRVLNVARLGYKRYNYTIVPTDTTTAKDLGTNLTQRGYPVLPRYEAANRFTLGSTNSPYSYSVNAGIEADDNVSWTLGNHNIQAGAQYLDLQYIHRYDQEPVIEAEVQNTSVSTADFILGLPFTLTVGNSTNISAVQHAFYFFAQDDWRATSRLTLNYGLRYELPFRWYQPDGQSITFIPGFQSKVFPQAPSSIAYQGDPGVDPGIAPVNYNNFAPRFGFNLDLFGNGHTAIRGGFGIFFDTLNANTVGIGQPYHYQATYNPPNGSFSNPLLGQPDVPDNYTGPANAQFVTPYSINFADANLKTPYTQAFNFGFQQRIAAATLEVNYVGKLGRHQMIPFDQNPTIYDCSGAYFQSNPGVYCPGGPGGGGSAVAQATSYVQRVKYPGFNYGGQGIVDNATIGTSNYNGLQMIYTQRSKRSLSTVASYTYSRSLDEQSNGATNTANVPTYNIRDNYGPSDFQATHVFNMGWRLNFPKVTRGSTLYRNVVNGWSFQGVYNVRTGNPYTVTISGDRSFTDSRTQRAQVWQPWLGVNLPANRHRTDKVAQYFNLEAFRDPSTGVCGTAPGSACKTNADCVTARLNGCTYVYGQPKYGTFGNIGRNSLYGPAYTQINFSLHRVFALYESSRVEGRVDAYNVFNTPNLANPQSSFSASATTATNVGQILSTVGNNGAATTNGRRVQLALILSF